MLRFLCIIAIIALASGQLQRVHLKKNPNQLLTVGNVRAERNYMMSKHNVQVNDNSTECVVSLDNYINHFYTGEITIGTPPQKLSAIFSTGASTLFVTTCLYSKNCSSALYNANASSSAFHATYTADYDGAIDYGDDYAILNGILGEDIVEVAGMKLENLPLVEMPSAEQFYSVDVVFGLGKLTTKPNYKYSEYGYYGPVYAMYQQGYIQNISFSLYWNENGGQVIFGGSDSSLYKGELDYHDFSTNEFGNFYLQPQSVTINNIEVNMNNNAYFDSGFNLIGCPLNAFVRISQQLGGIVDQEGHYYVDCSKVNTLPNVYYNFNGTEYILTPQAYIVNVTGPEALTPCMSAFTYINEGNWALGIPFLSQFYTEYDLEKNKIGIASPV